MRDLVHTYTALRRNWYKKPYMRMPNMFDRIQLYRFDHDLECKGYTSSAYAEWYTRYRLRRYKKFPTVDEFIKPKNVVAFMRYMKLKEKVRKKLVAVHDKQGRFVDIEEQ